MPVGNIFALPPTIKLLESKYPLHFHQSNGLLRWFFVSARWALLSSRRNLDARVGCVARRGTGGCATLLTNSCNRANASSLLASCVRKLCAFRMITPSAVIRLSFNAMSRSLTAFGSDDCGTLNRRWMAVDTLLTFCPPAPCARIAETSTSRSSISTILGKGTGFCA